MALFEVEVVPFSYFVEDVSSTVTSSPVDVVRVKPDFDTLSTVPDDPPAAGPDRALEPDAGWAAAAEVDVASPTESPSSGAISAAATSRPILLLGSNLRTLGRMDCLAVVTEGGPSVANAEDAGRPEWLVASEFPPLTGADFVRGNGRAGRVSAGLVGS
jgi:hypothetical protein